MLISSPDPTQQLRANGVSVMEYLVVVLSRDENRLSEKSFTAKLFSEKLGTECIKTAFVFLAKDKDLTPRILAIFRMVELVG